MNKSAIVKAILKKLVSELELYAKAARAAHAEATHEQSRAENKYDTRGLEASYLARGQSRQAAEIENAIKDYESLQLKKFTPTTPLDIGALAEVDNGHEHLYYFIGPRAGGTEVIIAKKEILVITPQSPLGQQLLGRKQGEQWQVQLPAGKQLFKILSVE